MPIADRKEQVKPLAPASHRLHIAEDTFSVELHYSRRRHRWIKLCGCSAAVLLIAVTVVLVLMFTVFHIKAPVSKMNAVSVNGVGAAGRNLTFDFEVSLKNPNAASFKFSNTTTYVYYGGSRIGEATGPPGEVRARKRAEMEASVGVVIGGSMGMMRMSSYTRISGKVKITRAIKRVFVVKLNCTMNVNVGTRVIQDLNCS